MKKKLEAELISIAHRILQLKHKEDVRELHHEAQKLYEKLSVLLFVEENFSDLKPTIGLPEIEKKLEKAFDFDEKIIVAEITEKEDHELVVEPKTETAPEVPKEEPKKTEEIVETIEKEVVAETPQTVAETPIIEIPKPDKKQISIDEILGGVTADPIFDRVSDLKKQEDAKISKEIAKIIDDKIEEKPASEVHVETVFSDVHDGKEVIFEKPAPEIQVETVFVDVTEGKDIVFEKADPKPATNLNDKLNKGINIGLNDRIAFEKNLFGGSSEDFNRVVSQLSTFDTFEDARNFIDELVKPDYNNWKGKDEFAERFMEFVENKFL
ncbi:hypothetical protein [Flavobacterium humi]|uniref:Uncharacterized protein n=1 Tax=Flavobacterium humi TaxID=2562683 RepID=A0A4Z0LCP4_9FLAO|nr:hypothetical protein [Flavobacterium humi]TGD59635.1 hypothetical protein E4635_01505 [Flavobacterium humi]